MSTTETTSTDNTIDGGNGADTIVGTDSNDLIDAGRGDDTVFSGEGDDTVYGGKGDDYIDGEDGNDTIFGDDGDDTIYGNAGNDILYGNKGNDIIYGDEGDDTIDAGEGQDYAYGGVGNDTLIFDTSLRDNFVEFDGGEDYDTVAFNFSQSYLDKANSLSKSGDFLKDLQDFFTPGGTTDFRDMGATGMNLVVHNVESIVFNVNLSDGDDTYGGSDASEVLEVGLGNDVWATRAGNDISVLKDYQGIKQWDGGADWDILSYAGLEGALLTTDYGYTFDALGTNATTYNVEALDYTFIQSQLDSTFYYSIEGTFSPLEQVNIDGSAYTLSLEPISLTSTFNATTSSAPTNYDILLSESGASVGSRAGGNKVNFSKKDGQSFQDAQIKGIDFGNGNHAVTLDANNGTNAFALRNMGTGSNNRLDITIGTHSEGNTRVEGSFSEINTFANERGTEDVIDVSLNTFTQVGNPTLVEYGIVAAAIAIFAKIAQPNPKDLVWKAAGNISLSGNQASNNDGNNAWSAYDYSSHRGSSASQTEWTVNSDNVASGGYRIQEFGTGDSLAWTTQLANSSAEITQSAGYFTVNNGTSLTALAGNPNSDAVTARGIGLLKTDANVSELKINLNDASSGLTTVRASADSLLVDLTGNSPVKATLTREASGGLNTQLEKAGAGNLKLVGEAKEFNFGTGNQEVVIDADLGNDPDTNPGGPPVIFRGQGNNLTTTWGVNSEGATRVEGFDSAVLYSGTASNGSSDIEISRDSASNITSVLRQNNLSIVEYSLAASAAVAIPLTIIGVAGAKATLRDAFSVSIDGISATMASSPPWAQVQNFTDFVGDGQTTAWSINADNFAQGGYRIQEFGTGDSLAWTTQLANSSAEITQSAGYFTVNNGTSLTALAGNPNSDAVTARGIGLLKTDANVSELKINLNDASSGLTTVRASADSLLVDLTGNSPVKATLTREASGGLNTQLEKAGAGSLKLVGEAREFNFGTGNQEVVIDADLGNDPDTNPGSPPVIFRGQGSNLTATWGANSEGATRVEGFDSAVLYSGIASNGAADLEISRDVASNTTAVLRKGNLSLVEFTLATAAVGIPLTIIGVAGATATFRDALTVSIDGSSATLASSPPWAQVQNLADFVGDEQATVWTVNADNFAQGGYRIHDAVGGDSLTWQTTNPGSTANIRIIDASNWEADAGVSDVLSVNGIRSLDFGQNTSIVAFATAGGASPIDTINSSATNALFDFGQSTVAATFDAQAQTVSWNPTVAINGFQNYAGGSESDTFIDASFADNTYTGNGGSDNWAFEADNGNDVITDFDPLVDKIDLSTLLTPLEYDQQANEVDGNTIITFDEANSLTLLNIGKADAKAGIVLGADVFISDANATENSTDMSFSFYVDSGSFAISAGTTFSFDATTSDGTATSGTDYTPAANDPWTLFDGGTIDIALLDDAIDEADETFDLTIANLTASSGIKVNIADGNATATIVDDDEATAEAEAAAAEAAAAEAAAAEAAAAEAAAAEAATVEAATVEAAAAEADTYTATVEYAATAEEDASLIA